MCASIHGGSVFDHMLAGQGEHSVSAHANRAPRACEGIGGCLLAEKGCSDTRLRGCTAEPPRRAAARRTGRISHDIAMDVGSPYGRYT